MKSIFYISISVLFLASCATNSGVVPIKEGFKINNVIFEINERQVGDFLYISYSVPYKYQKKVCKNKRGCLGSSTFRSAIEGIYKTKNVTTICNSKDMYPVGIYTASYYYDSHESTLGVTLRCAKSLSSIVIDNFYLKSRYNGDARKIMSFNSGFKEKTEIAINNLRITKYTSESNYIGCEYEYLSFSGPINEDATAVIERLLSNIKRCVGKYGDEAPVLVYMSSGGGLLKDGFSIGRLFNQNNIYTVVRSGDTCASSCATAFLGGDKRFLNGSSNLLFHAPYKVQQNVYGKTGINCQDNNQDLDKFYQEMIGKDEGNFLYKRTMDFCSARDGWRINKGAAELFGIISS